MDNDADEICSDQCVWGTFIDAYFKGFDVVYVEDCAGTTSPWYAEEVSYIASRPVNTSRGRSCFREKQSSKYADRWQMVRYNANGDGFLANSTYIIDALNKQK